MLCDVLSAYASSPVRLLQMGSSGMTSLCINLYVTVLLVISYTVICQWARDNTGQHLHMRVVAMVLPLHRGGCKRTKLTCLWGQVAVLRCGIRQNACHLWGDC